MVMCCYNNSTTQHELYVGETSAHRELRILAQRSSPLRSSSSSQLGILTQFPSAQGTHRYPWGLLSQTSVRDAAAAAAAAQRFTFQVMRQPFPLPDHYLPCNNLLEWSFVTSLSQFVTRFSLNIVWPIPGNILLKMSKFEVNLHTYLWFYWTTSINIR